MDAKNIDLMPVKQIPSICLCNCECDMLQVSTPSQQTPKTIISLLAKSQRVSLQLHLAWLSHGTRNDDCAGQIDVLTLCYTITLCSYNTVTLCDLSHLQVMEVYQPEAIVVCGGADSLSGDRLGCFNLSLEGHADCMEFLAKFGVPMLILGGGMHTLPCHIDIISSESLMWERDWLDCWSRQACAV